VAGLLLLAMALPVSSWAEGAPVPIRLQVELLFMIAGHDRNLSARAGGHVRTLVLTKETDGSAHVAAQFQAAAAAKPFVAGLPHQVEVAPFTRPSALAEACKARRVAIVYLTTGFTDREASAIGEALEGCSVLTATAAPAMVRHGIVLGFDLVSGRVKLLFDRVQASRQRVDFGPEVLALTAVPR